MGRALRDADGANLERIRILEGWLDRTSSAPPRIHGAGDRAPRWCRTIATAVALLVLAAAPSSGADGAPASTAGGASDAEALAKQLANPVASLISVPFQSNWDFGYGSDDEGWQYKLNVQPVVPISLSEEWNLISRTILPVVFQKEIFRGSGEQFGLGDTVQSLFLSPVEPGPLGVIWGVGPVFLLPTGTDELLGADRWGAGPTVVALEQTGPWTYGVLANHVWSFAGDGRRPHVSATFLQPFLNYTTKRATGFIVNTESTYDWRANQWTVPINAGVSQVLKLGGQRVQLALLGRWYAEAPRGGPEWGVRLAVTLLYPR